MSRYTAQPLMTEQPRLLIVLGWLAVAGCAIFALSILIADFIVPDHDWIADTISDLGAGQYEFIVDIGIYAFSAALLCLAVATAHVHLGGWDWSVATMGFVLLGLIVFLVGARNEYGDNDSEGVVIHIYLVYGLGVLMTVIPLLLVRGIRRVGKDHAVALVAIAGVWAVSAPIFFFLPTAVDGIYERYLGLISFALVLLMARLFILRGRALLRHEKTA